jgi:hypothetical protein
VIVDARQQYEMLYHFLGGYLTEDWFLDYGDPQVALRAFLDESVPEEIGEFLDQGFALLEREDFEPVFARLSYHLEPRHDCGMEPRDWWKSVLASAEAELKVRMVP